MKKVLLTAAAVSVLATSSAYAMEDMFYVKANVGWSKLDDYKNEGTKFKSKNDIHFGVGAGYHVMDNARVDLTFDHFVNPNSTDKSGKVKGDINTLLLNGYFDVFSVDAMKVFVGAGVGMGQVNAKHTPTTGTSTKFKQKNTFAYAAHVGLGYELAQGVNADLSYSYRDMGKTKKETGFKAVHFKGHHVTAGVRFDI